jgi:hypothetical protein
VPDADLGGGLERREHDQDVESVFARKEREPAHALNVLQVRALRVLPE